MGSPEAKSRSYRERPHLLLPSLFRKVAPGTVAGQNPPRPVLVIEDHRGRHNTEDPSPRSRKVEAERVLAWGRESPRSSRISGRRRTNALTAKAVLEDPAGALKRVEYVHTPPCRPVAAGNKLAARSHLTGDSGSRQASRWTELLRGAGVAGRPAPGREHSPSFEGCKILTRLPQRTACSNFNNYWIWERRKVGEVSFRSSARELRRGDRSAALPGFPQPAAQRVPRRPRKAAATACHLLKDTGAPRARAGGREPPPAPVS